MYSITIISTTATVDPDGTIGRILRIYYQATQVDNDLVAYTNSDTEIPLNYVPANIPYDTVTAADCEAWIRDLDDARIQQSLDILMEDQAKPLERNGLPWENSYPDWVLGIQYNIGDVVLYVTNTDIGSVPINYKCVQAHVSQSDWTPPKTPALWTVFTDPALGPQEWVQPTGAQDAYDYGVQVWWDAGAGIHLWTSEYSANTWEPGVFGWTDEGSYTP